MVEMDNAPLGAYRLAASVKEVIVQSSLRKPSLNTDHLTNYYLVWNLPLVVTIPEKGMIRQLSVYLDGLLIMRC